jgi:fucose 4-O-acetylase-like acetyltransferase
MSVLSSPDAVSASERPAPAPADEAARTSAAIGVARVVCILGVVYAHAWTGLGGDELAAAHGTPQGVLRWLLVEMFGRSAVPLLGMISGWLAAGSVVKRSYAGFLTSRARTILAPMVLWNALAVLLVSGAALSGWINAPVPTGWRDWADELLCLGGPSDINVQMPFLRDLFVCMAAAPLLARLPRGGLLAVAGLALAWTVSGLSVPLLLRPSILAFFAVGMLARREGWASRVGGLPIAALAVPFVGLALAAARVEASGAAAAPAWSVAMLDIALRFSAGAFFWAAAWRIARRAPADWLLKAEPFAFLMFCAHVVMIWLVGPLIGRVTGPLGSPLYPLFLIIQPPLVLLATVGVGRALVRLAPAAAKVLSGGRLPARARSIGALGEAAAA